MDDGKKTVGEIESRKKIIGEKNSSDERLRRHNKTDINDDSNGEKIKTSQDQDVETKTKDSLVSQTDKDNEFVNSPSSTGEGGGERKRSNSKQFEIRPRRANFRNELFPMLWLHFVNRWSSKLNTFLEILWPILIFGSFIIGFNSSLNWLPSTTTGYPPDIYDNQNLNNTNMKDGVYTLNVILKSFCHHHQDSEEFHPKNRICDNSRRGKGNSLVIVYSPNGNFTKSLIDKALQKIVSKYPNPQITLYGVENALEVEKKCTSLFISYEKTGQLSPVGIIFEKNGEKVNDVNLQYSIRTFVKKISNTGENTLLFGELDEDKSPVSPYLSSGFVSVQFALNLAFMDILAERGFTQSSTRSSFNRNVKEYLHRLNTRKEQISIVQIHSRRSNFNENLGQKLYFWSSLVLFVVLGYAGTSYMLVRRIILDKNGSNKLLRTHGLQTSVFWASIYIEIFLIRCITSCILTAVLIKGFELPQDILRDHDFFSIWLLFILHSLALTAFDFLISSLFSNAILGPLMSVLISILSYYVLGAYFSESENKLETFDSDVVRFWSKEVNLIASFFFPNWCLANGLFTFFNFGFQGKSKTLDYFVNKEQKLFGIFVADFIFIGTIIAYLGLTLCITGPFISLVKCLRNIKLRKRKVGAENDLESSEIGNIRKRPLVWEEMSGNASLTLALELNQLTVNYGDKVVLNHINIDFYKGQITALLGGSGSGKSTLLQTIAGLKSPSEGQVQFNGVNLHKNLKKLKYSIGYCPKKLSLYPKLSVRNHIILCCRLEGLDKKETRLKMAKLLAIFGLWEFRKYKISNLSQCQIVKLKIALTLIRPTSNTTTTDTTTTSKPNSQPELLILEEITYGLDWLCIQEIWKCLELVKPGRAVIVTTSSLREAELYADQIAFLVKGKIISCGSPTFLKKQFKAQALLKLRINKLNNSIIAAEKKKAQLSQKREGNSIEIERESDETEQYDADMMLTFMTREREEKYHEVFHRIEKYNPHGPKISRGEVIYTIPEDFPYLSRLLYRVEMEKNELGIDHISMSESSLETSFVKLTEFLDPNAYWVKSTKSTAVAHQLNLKNKKKSSRHIKKPDEDTIADVDDVDLPKRMEKHPKVCQQFHALFKKRLFSFYRRRKCLILAEITLPLIALAIFSIFANFLLIPQSSSPSRELSLSTFGKNGPKSRSNDQENDNYWKDPVEKIAKLALDDEKSLPLYTSPLHYSSVMNKKFTWISTGNWANWTWSELDGNEINGDNETFFGQDSDSVVMGIKRSRRHSQIFYDSNHPHSLPVVVNAYFNFILKLLNPLENQDNSSSTQYTVTTNNYPFQTSSFGRSSQNKDTSGIGRKYGTINDISNFLAAILLSLIISILSGFQIGFPVMEKTSGMKHLQMMSGIHPMVFWFSTFSFDFLLNFGIAILFILLILICDASETINTLPFALGMLFIIVFVYLCWTSLWFNYLISILFSFKEQSTPFTTILIIQMCSGIFLNVLTHMIIYPYAEAGNYDDAKSIGISVLLVVPYFFHFCPNYTLTSALINFCLILGEKNFCRKIPDSIKKACDNYQSSETKSAAHGNNFQFKTCCRMICEPHGTCSKSPDHFLGNPLGDGMTNLTEDLIILTAQGMVLCFLVFLVEIRVLNKFTRKILSRYNRKRARGDLRNSQESAEVRVERREVKKIILEKELKEERDEKEKKGRKKVISERESKDSSGEGEIKPYNDKNKNTCALIAHDLVKYKYAGNFFERLVRKWRYKALDHIDFHIERGSICGILSFSSKVKQTLVNILTARDENYLDSGDVYLCDMNHEIGVVKQSKIYPILKCKHPHGYLSKIGFCPKNLQLFPHLTGFNHLTLMASLRGLPKVEINRQAKIWLRLLGLKDGLIEQCQDYNSGKKFRLSLGMALIAHPDLIILEEPTIHLDPIEQSLFWDVLRHIKSPGQTFLYTSEEVDEVLRRSDKTIILSKSSVSSLGNSQNILKRYNDGYIIIVRLREYSENNDDDNESLKDIESTNTNSIDIGVMEMEGKGEITIQNDYNTLVQYILQGFKNIELLEESRGKKLLIFRIKDLQLELSVAMLMMEETKRQFPKLIDKFSIQDSGINQVILSLSQIEKDLVQDY